MSNTYHSSKLDLYKVFDNINIGMDRTRYSTFLYQISNIVSGLAVYSVSCSIFDQISGRIKYLIEYPTERIFGIRPSIKV